MCRMKSAIILKDRVFIPDYDSHTQMLEELRIEDTKENAEKLFVRAELSPENGDVFTDIDTWKFNVDQDIVPEWFVKDHEAERMRKAVKDWAKVHIHIDEDNLRIDSGVHWIKGGKNINIYGNATVKYICGSATVKYICDNATVITSGVYDWKNRDKAKLSDNATIKDKLNRCIIQAGDWAFVKVGEKK